ncbi:hypothetical protein V9T40_003880 [Parthenolecanium corni]|uniref:Neurotransmitter-gated ion-channel ligand-binding domain-containing protein n=1 Tax=Parthenolecanium corni TaxID=536013 RepID=A0AAN9TS69_9HEMI
MHDMNRLNYSLHNARWLCNGHLNTEHRQYTTHVLIRYRWMDKRLARNVTYNIQGETLVKERLWTPHLYIVNEHDSRIMGSSSQDVLVTVMPDGTVLYSTRKDIELKKVTSKHVLRATLTPQLNRRSISTIMTSSTQSLPSIQQQVHENNIRLYPKISSKQTLPSIESICSEPVNSSITINDPNPGLLKMTPQQIACWIDKRSRLFFPIAFLFFNIFYWIYVWL